MEAIDIRYFVECGIEYFISNGKGGHLQFKSFGVTIGDSFVMFVKSLEPVVDMHDNDCVIFSCGCIILTCLA